MKIGIPGSIRGWYEIPDFETPEDGLRKRAEYLESALRRIARTSDATIAEDAIAGKWVREVEDLPTEAA